LPLLRLSLSALRQPSSGLRGSAVLLLSLPLVAGAVPLPSGSLAPREAATPSERHGQRSSEAASLPAAGPSVQPRSEEGSPYRITPERRALLNTIRFAEGTWLGGSAEGYRTLYGGGQFTSLERHPEITVRRGYVSAAAGAYQFLPDTWEAAASRLGLDDFGPEAQDQAALHLIEKRGALQRFDRGGLCAEVLARLAPEWASLPTHGGGSYYGQPVKGVEELLAFYRQELERQRDIARSGQSETAQA